jgi:hypothetical protein
MTSCTKFYSANLRVEKKKQKNKNCCCAIVSHLRISSLLYIMADEAQSSHEIDPSKLNPLSPEVISKQATINIGMYQHTIVAHVNLSISSDRFVGYDQNIPQLWKCYFSKGQY